MPHPAQRALIRRSLTLWALVRLFAMTFSVLVTRLSGSVPVNSLWIVFACLGLGLIDIHRRGERALWANLGTSMPMVAVTFGATGLLGELALAVLRG